jgi:transcriptional regulator with XRE-family HTH domain
MTTKLSKGYSDDKLLEGLLGGPLTLGDALEAIRTTLELSQVDFAKKIGISKANLCDIEKGRRFVSPDKAAEFARRLGHPVTTFVKLSLQDQLRRAGLKLKIEVKAA